MSEETCSAEGLNSVLEEYKQSLNDVSQLIRTSQHNTSDQKTGEVSLEHLLKKAEEIQHLLEDGVDITNLFTPLESGLRLFRDILSKNSAEPVQSLDFSESTALPVGLSSKEWRGLKRRLNGHASDLEELFSGIRKKEELGPSCECLEPQLRKEEKGNLKYMLRCRSAGLFKCKFTSLMFKMERAGEVEYHSVPWKNSLEDLHNEPAGPLYSISCFPGTPVQIHLPHCEVISDGKQGHLRVAHITGEGLEIIKPTEITESHVVIDVTGLSTFGLITDYLLGRNIRAMVLLFLETSSEPELQVLLLSSNTDTEKVKTQRDKEICIDRNPYCEINTWRYYSLFTDHPGLTVTPDRAEYVERNPSFLPTFTVLCSKVEEKELTLTLKDEKDETKELWNSVVNIAKYLKLIKKDEKDETKELLNSVVNIEEKDTPDGRQHVSEPSAAGSSQANSESRTKYMIGDAAAAAGSSQANSESGTKYVIGDVAAAAGSSKPSSESRTKFVLEGDVAAAAGSSKPSSESRTKFVLEGAVGETFFQKHKGALKSRLPTVLGPILDQLEQMKVLNTNEREYIDSKTSGYKRNECLLGILDKRGSGAREIFYQVLKTKDPILVEDLERDCHAVAAAGSSQANSESRTKYMIGGQHFIDKHRIQLIESISTVAPILDRLMFKNVITQENYSHIHRKSTSNDSMRELFELGSIRSTTKGKDCLYDVLMELEPFVMDDLKERS